MRVAVFSIHGFEKDHLLSANNGQHELIFFSGKLNSETAVFAKNCKAVCVFVTDNLSSGTIEKLEKAGVKYIALRSAGFNHVDIDAVHKMKLQAARVPAYSPYAIAEHAVALMLALNRKLIRANDRIRQNNFSLDGQTGFNLRGKTAGIIGTGKIGSAVAEILAGFGCRLLAYDKMENRDLEKYKVKFTDLSTLCADSDIITLHVPLTEETTFLINKERIRSMKKGVMLINTSRGKVVKTDDVIDGLKSGIIGSFGLDVYENEAPLFFDDHSDKLLTDDLFARLITFSNVLVTAHQAFLTEEALKNIAQTTIDNINCFEKGISNENFL